MTSATEKTNNNVRSNNLIKTFPLPTFNSSHSSSPTLDSQTQNQSYENTDNRVPWMETVGNLIDRGILTWDHTGMILSCPEDEDFFKQQLQLISAKPLKYPILSF